MSNFTIGKSYEDFVGSVYQALLEAERRNGQIGHITIERRKRIISKSGTPAEIDIYWEYEIAGIKNCIAIECRNYNKKVDIPGVRDFARKISDISGLKGLMVTQKGFSANAIAEAKADNIDLLVVREHAKEDWKGYIKEVHICMHIISPARTVNLKTFVNKEWAAEQNFKDPVFFNARNDQTVIEDRATGFRYSLLELEGNNFFEANNYGRHVWKRAFQDGWVHISEQSIKIDAIEIEYIKSAPHETEMVIDFEQYVLAVMEYVSGCEGRFVVLKSGEKRKY